MSAINQQYIGYLNTPVLWKFTNAWEIRQFVMPKNTASTFNISVDKRLRLGKLVERFVGFELNTNENITVLSENIQIQHQKKTIGELDCILKQDDELIHLEIVYKFYLYDPEVGTTEYEHWIGPNRKDCLVDKLTKLKDKQLPLLYHPETKKHLDKLNISSTQIKQQVYFKAQLFIPYNLKTNVFKALNPDCISGFYITYNKLSLFKDCKFYIPEKIDWLRDIDIQIPWLNFLDFKTKIEVLINRETAPLCWIKYSNGLTKKCFIVWWL